MAAYQVLLLNTAVPQIQAAQSGDTYVVPRDIAFSAALTLSAGTANGVPYLDGSKVLTTGSALAYDGSSLKITGQLYVRSDANYLAMLNAADSLYWGRISQNGSDIEFYNRQSGGLKFGVVDAEAMRLTSTGLGIGTSSPGQKLEVNGAALVNGNSGFLRVSVTGTPASGSAALQLSVNSTNARTIRMENTLAGGHTYDIINGAGGVAGNLGIYDDTAGAYRLTLDSSGNLGLGVTPSAWLSTFKALQVGTAAVSQVANRAYLTANWYINSGGTNTYIASDYATMYRQQNGGHEWLTAASGTAGNAITFTQAMTLDASGNLGVGETSIAADTRLHLKSAGDIKLKVETTNTTLASGNAALVLTTGSYGYTIQNLTTTAGSAGVLRFYDNTAAVERARITSGGDFQTSSGNSVMVGGTAARATTAGTNRVDIFDGTAPVGTLANGISLYSSSGEAYVMDAAGNATLFSPHDAVTNEWIFRSKHTPTGKVLKIDVERLLKFVNDHFGLDAVHEFIED